MGIHTRYQPVGLPVSPIFECEVRTKRTFGCDIFRCKRKLRNGFKKIKKLNEK